MAKPISGTQARILHDGLTRLYLISLGMEREDVYSGSGAVSPEQDWDEITDMLAEANNVLRLRRRRRLEFLQSQLKIDE